MNPAAAAKERTQRLSTPDGVDGVVNQPLGFQALDDRSTLPVWLHDAGYDTVFLGKYLNGYGVQRLRDGKPSVRYVPPGWTDWRGSVDGGVPAGSALDGGTYRYFDTTLNVNGTLEPHEGTYQTSLFGQISREVIRQSARSPRPFSLHTSRHLMRLLARSDDQWRKYLFY